MKGCRTGDNQETGNQKERSIQKFFCPQEFGLVVTPWRRMVWDNVRTNNKLGVAWLYWKGSYACDGNGYVVSE